MLPGLEKSLTGKENNLWMNQENLPSDRTEIKYKAIFHMPAFCLHLLHSVSSQRIIPEFKSSRLVLLTCLSCPPEDATLGNFNVTRQTAAGNSIKASTTDDESWRWRHETLDANIQITWQSRGATLEHGIKMSTLHDLNCLAFTKATGGEPAIE